MDIDRRAVLAGAGGLAGLSALAAAADRTTGEDYAHPFARASDRREEIALLIYPGMTVLDIVGPYHFLCFMGGAKVHLVTNQPDVHPVVSDAGMGIVPTATMDDCPRQVDLVLVPGGTGGTLRAATDPRTLSFLRDVGGRARYVSSVCTGSLVLGAAGLLRGHRATSHWSVVDCLAQFGAKPVRKRFVADGNVITAAGVSAGLDSSIVLLERLRGRPLAEAAVLATEYAPQPPLPGGTVATARPDILRAVSGDLRPFVDKASRLTFG